MKNNKLRLNIFLLLAFSIFFITCKKEEAPKETNTNTSTTTTPPARTPLDYEIDYNVNMVYTVMVVSGNHYAIGLGKSNPTWVDGATITITQGDRILQKVTGATGTVSFNGIFKGLVSVNIQKPGYTTLSYLVSASGSVVQSNGTQIDLANLVSIFSKDDLASSANLAGRVSFQSNLTNELREAVPQNTKIVATIDADDPAFKASYFNQNGILIPTTSTNGKIVQYAYEAFFYDTTDAGGNYAITVPAGIAGLPFVLSTPDLVADQDLYENSGVSGFNRKVTVRTIFSSNVASTPTPVPLAGGASILFVTGSGASASASISGVGELEKINVSNGGSGYASAPRVVITGGGGTGATAVAVVAGGVVTAINLTSPGTGYTSEPSVSLIAGSGAQLNATIGGGSALKSVVVVNSGSGYTSVPSVTIGAPSLPGGVNATAVASINNGRVTGISITNAGSGYTSQPGIVIDAAGAGGVNASASAVLAGQSVQTVSIINTGSNYTGAPTLIFSEPNVLGGVRATASAQIDNTTGQIIGITILNPGSGYTSNPSISVISGSGASGQAITKGRSLTGVSILSQGDNYDFAPNVVITGGGGTGAAANAIISNGRVTGVTITNPGSGYLFAPNISFASGSGAQASVAINNGGVSSIKLINPGSGYSGAPRVIITPNGPGGGATANAVFDANTKTITSVNVTNAGTGFIGGNVPSVAEPFSITPSLSGDKILVKSGMTYIRDIHYGTGRRVE